MPPHDGDFWRMLVFLCGLPLPVLGAAFAWAVATIVSNHFETNLNLVTYWQIAGMAVGAICGKVLDRRSQ